MLECDGPDLALHDFVSVGDGVLQPLFRACPADGEGEPEGREEEPRGEINGFRVSEN